MRLFFLLLMLTLSSSYAISKEPAKNPSGPFIIESGTRQVSLVELYTSEGCSSCPRADRWLGTFVEKPVLWKTVIPVSFHVDYWNYLGWKDRYADPTFSTRQRTHKQQGNLDAVYTPGILVNGMEWRGLLEREAFPARPGSEPGNLRLVLEGHKVGLAFEPIGTLSAELSPTLSANLVLLGTGITNVIEGGENAGRTLAHEFVVFDYQLAHQSQTGQMLWMFDLNDIPAEATAIAGWVSSHDSQVPLQAVGGWLPKQSVQKTTLALIPAPELIRER